MAKRDLRGQPTDPTVLYRARWMALGTQGGSDRLSGLGIPQVRKRAARMGRNPATGEAIKIKASKKIAFRPAKELKEAV